MTRVTAYCGLDCSTCNAYIGTKNNDAALIERTAQEWSEMYHANVTPADVWCDGCTAKSDRHCGHWYDCDMRKCAVEHQAANCAACPEYGCQRMEAFMAMVPDLRPVLEQLHAQG